MCLYRNKLAYQNTFNKHGDEISNIPSNPEKVWKKKFKAQGYVAFDTRYVTSAGWNPRPICIVLIPFVFCEDGLNGKVYIVDYEKEKDKYGMLRMGLDYFGDYDINGGYVRLHNLYKNEYRSPYHVSDVIYKLSKEDSSFSVYGRMVGKSYDEKKKSMPETKIPSFVLSIIKEKFDWFE